MSSKVRWGGIAGVAAAALLIISAILNQMSPGSGAGNVYLDVVVLAAYTAVIVAVLGTAERLDTVDWGPSERR